MSGYFTSGFYCIPLTATIGKDTSPSQMMSAAAAVSGHYHDAIAAAAAASGVMVKRECFEPY